MAQIFNKEGRADLVLDSVRVVLQLQPDHAGALSVLAQAAHKKGRSEAAKYYFDKAKAADALRGEKAAELGAT
jgi:hypothetical protein